MSDASRARVQTARAAITLGLACDNACVFCAQEGLPRSTATREEASERLAEARAAGAREVTFVGGEPGLHAGLGALVARARELGFLEVGVQTNGVALAAPGRVDALVRAGLTDLHLSLHGAEARVHDWHTGVGGSFDAALRTLAAARAAGIGVAVVTVLTRPAFRVVSAMPRFLASRGVGAWCIEVPRWRGRAAVASDRVVPRLALALPFALHALDAARALGVRAFVRGAPSCLLGPLAAYALGGDVRAYDAPCEGCAARATCAGVDAEYLARYGAGELSPCAAVERRDASPADAAWRAIFVGVGETAPASDAPVPPPPARARVALPVLGRPSAARAEVPAGAPKQSGEALRAILPGLFEAREADDADVARKPGDPEGGGKS